MKDIIDIKESPMELAPLRSGHGESEEDHEMLACLARLNVWRIENLMSPNGMDRFV